MSDAPLTKCPACGKEKLRRLISAAGFRLKGAGWYETDFKSGGKRNLADSSSAQGDSTSKPEGSSGDAGTSGKSGSASDSPSSTSKPKTSTATEAS